MISQPVTWCGYDELNTDGGARKGAKRDGPARGRYSTAMDRKPRNFSSKWHVVGEAKRTATGLIYSASITSDDSY
jgi:hypothetical protein